MKINHQFTKLFSQALVLLLITVPYSLAEAPAYTDGSLSTKDQLFMLVTGGFGSFLIIFLGLGGGASLLLTRQGKSSNDTPVLGIAMLILAVGIFGLRIMIISGAMGFEYLEY